MLISTEIGSLKKYGSNERILQALKDAGFEAYDFSMFIGTKESFLYADDYLEQARKLKSFADGIGIVCNQAHAPFPIYLPEDFWYAKFLKEGIARESGKPFPVTEDVEEEFHALVSRLVVRAIEISGVLGAKHIVVHPVNNYTAEQNAEYYRTLAPVARRAGVKIAIENMWNWSQDKTHASRAACSHHDDFNRHLSLLDEDVFVACLDIGHAEMEGLDTSAVQMIHALGKRLQCLHVHDNDRKFDLHGLPCTNKIDFSAVCQALQEVGYTGDLTMEADTFFSHFEPSFYPKAMRYMYEIGDYLREKISSCKN